MNNKITFWKLITTISLAGLVLMPAQISYAWSNPTANPPTGTGSGGMTTLSGNVGIGMTAPAAKLQVSADSTTVLGANYNGAQVFISGGTNSNKRLMLGYDTTANYGVIGVYTAGSTVDNLLLNPAGGNVGIGTTAPSARLEVSSASGIAAMYFHQTADSYPTKWWGLDGSNNLWYGDGNNQAENFHVGGTARITGQTTFGNKVGIGITNPNTNFETIGKIQVKGSSGLGPDGTGTAAGEGLHLTYVDASNTGRVSSYTDSSSNGTLQLLGNDIQMFYGVGIQGLTLNSSGNVGIGVTSPDPNYKVTTSAGGVKAENNSATQPSGYFSNAGGGPAIQVGTGGFVTEARASDPSSTMVGQIWLRTDL